MEWRDCGLLRAPIEHTGKPRSVFRHAHVAPENGFKLYFVAAATKLYEVLMNAAPGGRFFYAFLWRNGGGCGILGIPNEKDARI